MSVPVLEASAVLIREMRELPTDEGIPTRLGNRVCFFVACSFTGALGSSAVRPVFRFDTFPAPSSDGKGEMDNEKHQNKNHLTSDQRNHIGKIPA